MPLRSKSQLRKCFAEQRRALSQGKEPSWDCHKMYHDTKTKFANLPERKVYTGKRGGLYVIKNGKKVYVQK
jgi:hypothetical protein